MLKKSLYLILGICWVILVTVGSLASLGSVVEVQGPFEHADKLVHACFYFTSVILFFLHYRNFNISYLIPKIALSAWLYGMVIEVLQNVMPYGRDLELLDMVANTMGIFLAVVFIRFFLDEQAVKKEKYSCN